MKNQNLTMMMMMMTSFNKKNPAKAGFFIEPILYIFSYQPGHNS